MFFFSGGWVFTLYLLGVEKLTLIVEKSKYVGKENLWRRFAWANFFCVLPCIKLLFYCQGSIMYVESCVCIPKTSINIRTTKYTK